MMKPFADLLIRFRKDERGVFLVIFALLAIVIIAASGAVVDFTRVQQSRTRAQIALDAAALALQTTINNTGVTAATLKVKAQALLTERIGDSTVTAVVEAATPDTDAGKLTITGYISVPTYFVQLVGIKDIRSAMLSEVTRSSNHLEVSVSLDVTGSMAGSKITSLKSATNTLIDLLVKDTQTPTYSKMAIVPWSNGVNLSSTYSDSIRGTPIGGVTISSATWMAGTSKTITAVTQASPARVTTSATHGLSVGDYVYITNVSGMTNLNNNIYKVGTVPTTTRVTLQTTSGANVNSTSWSTFSTSGGPKITKCHNSSCQLLVTTSAGHNLSTGNTVYIAAASGLTSLNAVHVGSVGAVPTTSSFYLTSRNSDSVLYTNYTANSGSSYCTYYGCKYLYFTNAASGAELWQVNNCATERRITNAYTDTAPSTTPVGMSYRQSAAECIPQLIVPLTADKTDLKALVTSIAANGSTAGHIGLAWGWYMIAPNWAYLWPTESQPKAYDAANLIKAVIFMTDGEFNTVHCKGVIAADTLSNSQVASSERINCNSDNGLSSKDQAQKFCDSIKVASNDVVLYTVGFDLANNAAALTFLQNCATAPEYFYQADTGADLTAAFTAIAQSLSELRISK